MKNKNGNENKRKKENKQNIENKDNTKNKGNIKNKGKIENKENKEENCRIQKMEIHGNCDGVRRAQMTEKSRHHAYADRKSGYHADIDRDPRYRMGSAAESGHRAYADRKGLHDRQIKSARSLGGHGGLTHYMELASEVCGKACAKAVSILRGAIYPESIYCMSCGCPIRPSAVYSLCDDCLQNIKWANGKLCRICGKMLEDWYPVLVCAECAASERLFDAGISCFQYTDRERLLIKKFKYGGHGYMARKLAEIIFDKITAVGYKFDIIIPVPMYYKKERERGYNQAELLSRFLGEYTGLPVVADCLFRIRETAPMNKLGSRDRKKNLDGAFAVDSERAHILDGSIVLLVDDIYTTGTTMNHCSMLLREAGAKRIVIAAVAAGFNQRKLPDISGFSAEDAGDFRQE